MMMNDDNALGNRPLHKNNEKMWILLAENRITKSWLQRTKTYLIKSAIEIIFKPSLFANSRSLGKRAIEPSSSSTISHKTATGGKPASVARSTEASVCPALFRTPPSLNFKGKIWPGRLKSSGFEVGEARPKIVLALSTAETPVVVPSLASYRKKV